MAHNDVMIGSRYIRGGGDAGWPAFPLNDQQDRQRNRCGCFSACKCTTPVAAITLLPGRQAPANAMLTDFVVARLLVPAGNALPLPSRRQQDQRNPDHLRQSQVGQIESQTRRESARIAVVNDSLFGDTLCGVRNRQGSGAAEEGSATNHFPVKTTLPLPSSISSSSTCTSPGWTRNSSPRRSCADRPAPSRTTR